MKHDHITSESQETAALYALGALSQHEAREFDVHLREACEVCESELNQFEQIVGELGSSTAPVAPPAYLRDLLTARIEKETSDGKPASVIPFPEHFAQHKAAPVRESSARVWLPWAVAATLLVAFVYSFATWRAERQSLRAAVEEVKGSTSAALEENTQLSAKLNRESAMTAELAQINSVLSSPQWRMIPLAGLDPAPSSSAKVYWDVQGKRWVVTADLPPAPAGKVYQLWCVTATAKISAGLIRPDTSGHGFSVLQFPQNVDQLAAAAITLEPEGGSPQPTMPIYLLGKAA